MSLETKILLVSMAQFAIATQNKPMYDYVAALANAESLVLPDYPKTPESDG